MLFKLGADIVMMAHGVFVAFVVLGGLIVLFRPKVAWLHIPAAAWGAWIPFAGWGCPLTHLEKALRVAGGGIAYPGGFIEWYLLPLVHPELLSSDRRMTLGVAVVLVNLLIYLVVILQIVRRRVDRPVSESREP